ncbi:MAG: ATP-binding protein [Chitinophagales bacterium]
MNIKWLFDYLLNFGIKKEDNKEIALKVRMLNVDALMSTLIPIFVLLAYYIDRVYLHPLLVALLIGTIFVSWIVFALNRFYLHSVSNVLMLSYFLIVILFLAFWLGEESYLHLLLIAIGMSGFIYYLGRPYQSFAVFGSYMGIFGILYLLDFEFFYGRLELDSKSMSFIKNVSISAFFIILIYKMLGLVLIYEELLRATRESEVSFRNLYEYNPVGIAISDGIGIITQANPTLCDWLGYEEKELIGLSAADISFEKDRERERIAAKDLVEDESDNFVIEKRFIKKTGEIVWSNLSVAVIRDKQRHIVNAIGMVEDISKRKKQQLIIENNVEQLNLKNAELKKYIESNMQLENFAYIASHDLKEPICSIQGLVDLLELSASEKFDEDEKQYLLMLKKATINMQKLIEDLLTYSRVNSQSVNFDILNINCLLETIQFDLRAKIQEKNASIQVENLPTAINADATKFRQLLQNLITNAIKFQAEGITPVVKISCTDQGGHWLFAVQDNGIGIQPEFHEKIFLLFRRLHSRSEFEGTGIGLAICKKIVEEHGGRIWVDSNGNKGTTFYFSIHKNLA